MRLLRRRRSAPRAKTIRPAERYLAAGAEEARRLGHSYVGTEHVLLALTRDPNSGAARVLRHFDVTHGDIEESPCLAALWPPGTSPRRIDPDALATFGVDFESVRERLEERFGPGALDHTQAGCMDVACRLKEALAYSLDHAQGRPLRDEHVLLGMLSVPDSLAAHVLRELGISVSAVYEIVQPESDAG